MKPQSQPIFPGANPALVKADQERRRSNAARPVPSRKAHRQTSRADSQRAAVRDAS